MYLPFVLAVGVAVFVVQLVLCLGCRNVLRFAPVGVLAMMELGLWGSFFLIRPGFYAFYFGMVGLVWLAAAGLAWLIFGIVQLVQKRRK